MMNDEQQPAPHAIDYETPSPPPEPRRGSGWLLVRQVLFVIGCLFALALLLWPLWVRHVLRGSFW